MEEKQLKKQQAYCRSACKVALVAAVVIAVSRIVLTPIAFDQALPYGLVLGVTGVLLAFFLVFSRLQNVVPITVGGRKARISAAAAAVAGAAMVIFSLVAAYDWQFFSVMPYPDRVAANGADKLFFYLLVIAGLAGGALFLFLSVKWWRVGITVRNFHPLLALAPVLWIWMRLLRYITSYASSIGLFRNLYDLATIVFEMLFFVLLARYLSGVGDSSLRFFFGISLCTGLLCTISGLSQLVFFVIQDAASFETCALVTAPDFGIGFFAFLMAFSQGFGTACEEPEEGFVVTQEDNDDPSDGEGAEYLISDQWFSVYDPEDDEEND